VISPRAAPDAEVPRAPTARDPLRRQFQVAHDLLDAAVDECPSHRAYPHPRDAEGATAAAWYAQTVVCEDIVVSGVAAREAPLALSTWSGRTGLSELPPLARCINERTAGAAPWAGTVRIDARALRAYARAVYASTDAAIGALPVDALDPARRGSPACILTALLLTVAARRGELMLVFKSWSHA